MATTRIEWADRVWNPITGCTTCSPACDNCYAERMSKRLAGRCGYPADEPFRVTLHDDKLFEPKNWKKPARIFVGSMTDLFHPDVPFAWLDMLFATMGQCKRHTFLLLTKRPERMQEFMLQGCEWRLPNVWPGTTIWDQASLERNLPFLLTTPAAKRFVSVEPMLGPVNFSVLRHGSDHDLPVFGTEWGPDWVICGGETGPGARPMHPDWPRSLRDQCQAAGVPFFFKQWGEWHTAHTNICTGEPSWWAFTDFQHYCNKAPTHMSRGDKLICPDGHIPTSGCKEGKSYPMVPVRRVGKKRAGRVLDGRTWEEVPNA